MNPLQTSLKPPNAVELAMDLVLSKLANTGNNQPTTIQNHECHPAA